MARKRRVTRQSKVEYTESKLSYQETEYERFSSKIQTTKLIKPLNPRQKEYIKSIKEKVVTLCEGSPGTSKTLLALHTSICLLNEESSPIEKIFYIRANVGISEEKDIGYLPGDKNAKILPLAYPVLDSLINFMSEGNAKYLIESSKIEVLPISMVRGRSFRNSIVIVDECANCSPNTILTLLTRVGENSKMLLLGNSKQKDTVATIKDGLKDAINRLQGLPQVGIVIFKDEDIVRSSVIKDILIRYEKTI